MKIRLTASKSEKAKSALSGVLLVVVTTIAGELGSVLADAPLILHSEQAPLPARLVRPMDASTCRQLARIQLEMGAEAERRVGAEVVLFVSLLNQVRKLLAPEDLRTLLAYKTLYTSIQTLLDADPTSIPATSPLLFQIENLRSGIQHRLSEYLAKLPGTAALAPAASRSIVGKGQAVLEICNGYESSLRHCTSLDVTSDTMRGTTPRESLDHPGIFRQRAFGFGNGRYVEVESGERYDLIASYGYIEENCGPKVLEGAMSFHDEPGMLRINNDYLIAGSPDAELFRGSLRIRHTSAR